MWEELQSKAWGVIATWKSGRSGWCREIRFIFCRVPLVIRSPCLYSWHHLFLKDGESHFWYSQHEESLFKISCSQSSVHLKAVKSLLKQISADFKIQLCPPPPHYHQPETTGLRRSEFFSVLLVVSSNVCRKQFVYLHRSISKHLQECLVSPLDVLLNWFRKGIYFGCSGFMFWESSVCLSGWPTNPPERNKDLEKIFERPTSE